MNGLKNLWVRVPAAATFLCLLGVSAVAQRAMPDFPVTFVPPGELEARRAMLMTVSGKAASVIVYRPQSRDEMGTVLLPPGDAVLHGSNGAGLLASVRAGQASTLYAIDIFGPKPTIRAVYSTHGGGDISALSYNAKEKALYLLDTSRRALVRMWAPPSGNGRLTVHALDIFSLPQECCEGKVHVTANVSDDPDLGLDDGIILIRYNGNYSWESSLWRIAVRCDELVIERLDHEDLRFLPDSSWQVRHVGGGLVHVTGRRPGRPSIAMAASGKPFGAVECFASGSQGGGIGVVDLRLLRNEMGSWWKVVNGGLHDSRPIFGCLRLPCADGAGMSSLKLEPEYPHVLHPGADCFPVSVSIGKVMLSGPDSVKLVVLATIVGSEEFWSGNMSRVDFANAACASAVVAAGGQSVLRCGLRVPDSARIGDCCAWQALVFDGKTNRLLAASCVSLAPIVPRLAKSVSAVADGMTVVVDLKDSDPKEAGAWLDRVKDLGLQPAAR
ncbi:MAG: hypothetical protein JNK49_05705 [Planctomycetes bacterium]|nr:hypothetical protein [Planctomycetota bacterium]